MDIVYNIDNIGHNISIEKNLSQKFVRQIERAKSDKKILLIYDKNIETKFIKNFHELLKLSGCKIFLLRLEGNKSNKNEKILFKILDYLISKNFTKKSILISIGGGVLGDVCGLAASLYLRGLIFYQIPSTMTAMVDSCIGGKTAINYKKIINSIGNYYHPYHVYIFNDLIQKLPTKEFLAGIPEILKCGLIKKNNIIKYLKNNKESIVSREFDTIKKLISEALLTKIYFFQNDIYEKNTRLFLNFGHTFAHAFEMSTAKLIKSDYLRHGEAVGIGILCELYYSNKKSKYIRLVEKILSDFHLPTRVLDENIYETNLIQKIQSQTYKYVFLDKKKINNYPRYVSLKKDYRPKIEEMKNNELIDESIFKFIK